MTRPTRHFIIWAIIIGLSGWFISSVSAILLPFILGAMMAYLLDPLVDRLQTENMKRGPATALVTVTTFAALTFLFVLLIPLIGEQLSRLLQEVPQQMDKLYDRYIYDFKSYIYQLPEEQAGAIEEALTNVPEVAGSAIKNMLDTLFTSSTSILNLISLLLITPVVAFYLLRDWDNIIAKIDSLLPRTHAPIIREQIKKMDVTISGFLRGQLLVCSLLALFYVIGLTIAGLNFSVVIGAAAGFLIIIPYVGWLAAASVGMMVAILQYDAATPVIIIGAIFLAGQALESYFLTPNMVGDRVGLHPVWIIFGMLAGGVLLGFVGVLLAIPLSAIIGVLIRFAIERYRESDLYLGDSSQSSSG